MEAITEARRYLDNAKEILREKAKKEDGYYQDSKYVKMAGHTAYVGVLVALDNLFGKKIKGRKDVDWYKSNLAKTDKKILNAFLSAYELLHLAMAYDGIQDAEIAQTAFTRAESIINWAETKKTAA